MAAIRRTDAVIARDGVYMVVRGNLGARALVDAGLPVEMPRLKDAIDEIGEILAGVSPESLALSIKFERGPEAVRSADQNDRRPVVVREHMALAS